MASTHVVLHIPKTGGSSIRATFDKCEGFQFPQHSTIATGDRCNTTVYYAVLRQPYERLFSSFSYYKYGSQLYNPRRNIATNLSFYQFLHGWSDSQSAAHLRCTRITTIRDWKRTPWVWRAHFTPQYHWVANCNPKILCYSKVLLNTFHEATNCTLTHPKHVNPTFPNMEHKPSWSKLNANLKAFLLEKYKKDFELYDIHCSSAR